MADYGDDNGIMATNDSANLAKRCCVQLNYWEDPFIECLSRGHGDRKPPEINRGYYARVSALTQLINQLISVIDKTGSPFQIVNLGAGFDTLYWRLKQLYLSNKKHGPSATLKAFVEIDMIAVTMHKVHCIRRRGKLLQVLGEDIRFSSSEMHATDYHLITADLRTVGTTEGAKVLHDKLFKDCALDPEVPTIFLSECVLVYMEPSFSGSLLQWISTQFPKCFHLNYEQVNLNDRFGEVMLDNLHDIHADLLGLPVCESIQTQEQRFTSNGFDEAKSWDMSHIYNQFLPRPEIQRIEKIEFLDERNLLEQLLSHYCITVASKGMGHHVRVEDLVH